MKTGENEPLPNARNAHAMLALAVQGLGLGLLDLPACIDTHYRCLRRDHEGEAQSRLVCCWVTWGSAGQHWLQRCVTCDV